jgi:hypothetical protein
LQIANAFDGFQFLEFPRERIQVDKNWCLCEFFFLWGKPLSSISHVQLDRVEEIGAFLKEFFSLRRVREDICE